MLVLFSALFAVESPVMKLLNLTLVKAWLDAGKTRAQRRESPANRETEAFTERLPGDLFTEGDEVNEVILDIAD